MIASPLPKLKEPSIGWDDHDVGTAIIQKREILIAR
ncbi:MAG: hypothetical protein ACI8RD_003791 [Bacillariaceae sp.]|jgi:hypothetical protein